MKQRLPRFFGIILFVSVFFALLFGLSILQPRDTDAQGPTTFTNLNVVGLSATATPLTVINQAETGAARGIIAEFQDQSTPIARIDRDGITLVTGTLSGGGGGLDLNGNSLTLDADADSTFTCDTDDQCDLALGGGDVLTLKEFGSSTIVTTTTTHLLEIFDTTNVMSAGVNSLVGVNVDLGIGNSTGGTNNVYGVLIDGITGDAQNTETAISVGSGWDVGADLGNNALVNVGAAGTDFSATGGLTLADSLSVSSGGMSVDAGISVFSGGINCTPQTEAVTATFVITPTSCIIFMTSTSEFTSSTATPIVTSTATSGDIIIIRNDNASDAINIDGTGGTVECGGNFALGAGDTKSLLYAGTDEIWNCWPNNN